MMTSEEYKKLLLREFDQAAEKFDDNDPSVYNMCRKDYPDVLAEVIKEPFSDLLDAGCGTGAMLGMFRSDHPDKNYTGVDVVTCSMSFHHYPDPGLELIKEISFWDEVKKYTLSGKIGSVIAKNLNNRLTVYRWGRQVRFNR